ncbi:MAG: hypothetical protein PGN12_09965 [Sphingomonas phyllosphaerae]
MAKTVFFNADINRTSCTRSLIELNAYVYEPVPWLWTEAAEPVRNGAFISGLIAFRKPAKAKLTEATCGKYFAILHHLDTFAA